MSMTEVQEAFYELMYGYGKWFGIFFFIITISLASYKMGKMGILLVPLIFLLGIEYNANIGGSSDFMWASILLILTSVFVFWNIVTDIYD